MPIPFRFASPGQWLLFAGLVLAVAPLAAATGTDPRATALIEQLELREHPVAARDLPGWQVPRRIVVPPRIPAPILASLREAAPGVEIVLLAEAGPARAEQLAGTQAVLGICDAETLAAAPELHWIQTLHVGVEDCVSVPGLAERGIVLSNMQRTSAPPIAEHAIAMMMSLARGLPRYAVHQQAQQWQDERRHMREIGGKTLLVVGLGGIGTEVARRGHGLGMRVIATRNSSREGPAFVEKVGLSSELLELAAEADVVISAVPLTPDTTNLFDQAFFDTMKPGGYFINMGRGRSVVTDDLVAALRSGQLAGAGLDVTEPEPLPAGHPLWSLPNVIISPHVSSGSDVQAQRSGLLLVENVRRYAAGEPLLNVVDIERGY
jgi:phosphoglycerate dehydrogenase-like enzyme